MLHRIRPFRALSLLLLLSPAATAGTLYVDADLTTGLGDGSTWDDAFQGPDGLKDALAVAVANDRIFVAEGSYRTNSGSGRVASFTLLSNVEIYGSFLGGEADPSERPPFGTAPSILTADLNGDDGSAGNTENSYHVVRGGSTDATAVLDGFVLSGGNANGNGNNDRGGGALLLNSSPTFRNCRFVGSQCTFGGGAVYITGGAPSFTDCTFENNIGGAFGGAFDIAVAGAVRFDRCVFEGNRASRAGALEIFSTTGVVVSDSLFRGNTATGGSGGGAIWTGNGGSTDILSCTVVENAATVQAAGGLRNQGAAVTVANSVFWDNSGAGGAQGSVNQISGTSAVTYTIVEGGFAGTGNLGTDPQFKDLAGGDFALMLTSPAVDAGNNAALAAGVTLDLLGNPRQYDEPCIADTGAGTAPIVDMGAYEFQGTIGTVYCSPAVPNSTGLPGVMKITGSNVVAADDLTLTALQLPTNSNIGYFIMGTGMNTFIPAGSVGAICVSPGIKRYLPPVNNTNQFPGGFSRVVGTSGSISGNISVDSTWNFQAWHRDSMAGTSNLTDAVSVTFE